MKESNAGSLSNQTQNQARIVLITTNRTYAEMLQVYLREECKFGTRKDSEHNYFVFWLCLWKIIEAKPFL